MNGCIEYLIIRQLALGAQFRFGAPGDLLSAAVFALVLALGARDFWSKHREGWLDTICPFSVRRRLANQGEPGNHDVSVANIVSFLLLPVAYFTLPTLLQSYTGAFGSYTAALWSCVTLTVGWVLRTPERFGFDCCVP